MERTWVGLACNGGCETGPHNGNRQLQLRLVARHQLLTHVLPQGVRIGEVPELLVGLSPLVGFCLGGL